MALISVIENTVVKQRGLLEHRDMLDAISLANLLPGPQAVNVVAFAGYRLRGGMGALAAAAGVILPSFLLLLALSYLYFRYGEIVALQKAFQGFIPAVAAIVLSVAWRMGRKTITGTREALLVAIAAGVLALVPLAYKVYAPPAIIAAFALIGVYLFRDLRKVGAKTMAGNPMSWRRFLVVAGLLAALALLWFFPLPLERNSLALLTLTFASMSLMLFGGGYVFIPIIGSIVVGEYAWLSQQEFTDGIAMGQITPGPILISATFIGYKVAGLAGATLSTIAIFMPPAILMVTASQALDRIRQSAVTQSAMRAIHCGVIGMIIVAAFVILRTALPVWPIDPGHAWPTLLILCGSLVGLIRFNLDVLWIIPAAGVLGYLLY
jgi:chromate transporter